MRTITVDKEGLSFTLKLAGLFLFAWGGWYAWEPVSSLVQAGVEEDAGVASASESSKEFSFEETYIIPSTSNLRGKYIFVDTEQMRVTLYDGSEEQGSFLIRHIPNHTSPDALVPGSHTVDAVEEVTVSTVTLVRYPYYVTFGGTYAFHGTPTDTADTALSDDYPGNSVLLSFEDAKTVATFAEPGMVVYVAARVPDTVPATTTTAALAHTGELPATSATAYGLRDLESGQVYLVKSGDEQYPIASITKLMTAAVASDVIGHGEQVLAQNGEHYTLGDLFYPLLLRSDNAIAERIAVHTGREEFIAHMNAYARAQGMHQSSFADSSGLSPENVSSANDLMIFAQHLHNLKEYLLTMTGETEMTITSTEGNDRRVVNQNKLADDPHFRGGKLGYTDEAGQTSLAIFNVPLGGETRPVAVIVLGSQDWKQDTRTLLRWLVDSAKQ